MSTGEQFFTWGWPHFLLIGSLMGMYLLLSFRNKLPPMSAFKEFLDAVNSAGGHIFILLILSIWAIRIEMQFIYHVIALPDEDFSKHNSVIMVGLSAVQAGLAGTFTGALLKTMSGGKAETVPPIEPIQGQRDEQARTKGEGPPTREPLQGT